MQIAMASLFYLAQTREYHIRERTMTTTTAMGGKGIRDGMDGALVWSLSPPSSRQVLPALVWPFVVDFERRVGSIFTNSLTKRLFLLFHRATVLF